MCMCVELVRKQKPRSASLGKGLGSGAAAVDSLSADERRQRSRSSCVGGRSGLHLKYVPFGDDAHESAHACDENLRERISCIAAVLLQWFLERDEG